MNVDGPLLGFDAFHVLEEAVQKEGLALPKARLEGIRATLELDLSSLETLLLELAEGADVAQRAARHLLVRPGKRVRAACTLLASRVGPVPRPKPALAVAVAAELVHAATLLHDDVIDLGEQRRGAPTARLVFGNSASILAGDWVLVEALAQVRSTADDRILDELLLALRRIVAAESKQLAQRGRPCAEPQLALEIALGKTGALFAWSLRAGGLVGGADAVSLDALGQYGHALGLAFQISDDLLDLSGRADTIGKTVLQDLHEGKASYPLALALSRDPSAEVLLAEGASPQLISEVLTRTCALEDSRVELQSHLERSVRMLSPLPSAPVRAALTELAFAIGKRDR